MTVARAMITKGTLPVSVVLTAMPSLAWSHPGHGLEVIWLHDMLHGATAVGAIALVTLLTVRCIRYRRQKQRS